MKHPRESRNISAIIQLTNLHELQTLRDPWTVVTQPRLKTNGLKGLDFGNFCGFGFRMRGYLLFEFCKNTS